VGKTEVPPCNKVPKKPIWIDRLPGNRTPCCKYLFVVNNGDMGTIVVADHGKAGFMNIAAVRNDLRTQHSRDLGTRRKLIALSALGLADFSIISLYQTGIIRHLPDIPHPLFDSDQVNGSEEAYRFGVPDGPISAVAYAATMLLAAAGGSKHTGRTSALDLALGATIAGNAAGAVFYLYKMIFEQRKICLYCVTGAVINIASLVLITPTVVRSLGKLFRSK
jgi:uncharacterized membrane protein